MEDELVENKMHSKRLGREMAMQFLFQCDMNSDIPDMALWDEFYDQIKIEHKLRENRYARKGKEYAEMLFSGVVMNREDIDETIKERSKNWEFERLSLVDLNVMRLAVYEMLYVSDVPPVVSINEAVEIAMDYSGEKSGSFINGVLNGIKDTLDRPAREAVDEL